MNESALQTLDLNTDIEDALRIVPGVLERLRRSTNELEARAERVEQELVRTNEELNRKVHQLDSLKRHLEAVLESIPNGVLERDAEGRIVRVNRAAQQLLAVEADELQGLRDHPSLPPLAADGQHREVLRVDGERLVLASYYATVESRDGSVNGSVEILDDRTEATALSERLHSADKMAALGTLAAGVAHEIRNPLNAVKGFASLLRNTLGEGETEQRLLNWANNIIAGAVEMDSIVENMLTFGSPERLRTEQIDPEELIEGALRAARTDENLSDDFEVAIESSASPFVGDRIKLRQALRNLIENAIAAQPHTARLRISAHTEEDETVFRVEDAGPGISTDLAKRIFDPFFTTHADGTGLGLALVATITRLHGGCVEVSPLPSSLGGAEILLRIPRPPA